MAVPSQAFFFFFRNSTASRIVFLVLYSTAGFWRIVMPGIFIFLIVGAGLERYYGINISLARVFVCFFYFYLSIFFYLNASGIGNHWWAARL